MKVVVAYIAVTHGTATEDFASRFSATYQMFPAGHDHQLIIACNGGPLSFERAMLFANLNCEFFPRQNDPGWDLSAYIDIAKQTDADMLVCLGESVYFHRAGWLARLVDAWVKHGPGMYSPFASHCVRAHLNTTAFACSPKHIAKYPYPVVDRATRYAFEHGENAMWRILNRLGYPVMMVTWDGEWMPGQWRYPDNIMMRGNQSNCLMFCNHSDRWALAPLHTKLSMSAASDRPFK